MGAFGYVACCFALFAFCTADLVTEGRNDVVTPFLDYAGRLVGGPDHREGRFELAIDRIWGTVCDAGFSDIDAQVACVNLGFEQGQGTFLRNTYGPGTGAIYFSDYDCEGTELAIDDCPHSAQGDVGRCTHDDDVSISCVGDGGFPVRLVGGIHPYEGRLEIQYQGTWGTVCNHFFEVQDAQVACNSLGFGNQGYMVVNSFGQATGAINLDEVDCTGDETSIGYCAHAPWGVNNCDHDKDVAISCSSLDVAARLTGGATPNEGRLEFFLYNQWATVCDSGFGDIEAQVACNNLGFEAGQGTFLGNQFGPGTGMILIDNVVCDGTEPILNECQHSAIGATNCTHDNDVSISCVGSGYDVRLVGGSEIEGRVEVFHRGEWGTICIRYWDEEDTHVVCNTLGFGFIGRALGGYPYGQGTGKIWLNDLGCVGDEPNIGSCAHSPWGVHDCAHDEDVSVICTVDVV